MANDEPFKQIPYDKEIFLKDIDFPNKNIDDSLPAPRFRISRLVSCYWDYIHEFHDYINVPTPLPITDDLQEIFKIGTKVHYEEEVLNCGAKRIIKQEQGLKIQHLSGYTITRHSDSEEMDLKGIFYRDYKTTNHQRHFPEAMRLNDKINYKDGFFWFLINPNNFDYNYQLGCYDYTGYICNKPYHNAGVVTKIDKNNPRNRISLEIDIPSLNEIREFIITHPVIQCVYQKITIKEMLIRAIQHNQRYKNSKGKCYKCVNCQYGLTEQCPIINKI